MEFTEYEETSNTGFEIEGIVNLNGIDYEVRVVDDDLEGFVNMTDTEYEVDTTLTQLDGDGEIEAVVMVKVDEVLGEEDNHLYDSPDSIDSFKLVKLGSFRVA